MEVYCVKHQAKGIKDLPHTGEASRRSGVCKVNSGGRR